MFNKISILIPFQSDHGPRDSAFCWIRKYYTKMMPEAEVCIGESNRQPFNRCRAINKAAAQATRDIYVVADNDIIYEPQAIAEAIRYLEHYPWVVPFRISRNLTQEKTNELLKSEPAWPINVAPEDYQPMDFSAFGAARLIVLPRRNFEAAGGFDERFTGWGREDDAFTFAMETLCGKSKRLDYEIYHFWHPFVGPGGNPHIRDNDLLWLRYSQAHENPEAMTELIRSRHQKGR